MAGWLSDAILMLNSDFSLLAGNPTKDKLLIGIIQRGIDNYGVARMHNDIWLIGGGHANGRKLPIVLAGSKMTLRQTS